MVIWNRRNYLDCLNLAKTKKVCLVGIHLSQALEFIPLGCSAFVKLEKIPKIIENKTLLLPPFCLHLCVNFPWSSCSQKAWHMFSQIMRVREVLFLLSFAGVKQQYFILCKFPKIGSYCRLRFFSPGNISTSLLFIGLLWTKKNFPYNSKKIILHHSFPCWSFFLKYKQCLT